MVQAQTCSWDYLGSQGVSEGTGEWTELEYHPISGELYVAFQDEANGSKITVMKFDGTSWSNVGTPGISAGEAYHPDLEFDSMGNLYVLYRGLPNFSYSVKTFDGLNWVHVGVADFTGSSNGAGTLAIHPLTDELYMAYPDLENSMGNRLSVRKFDGTAWNLVGPQGITATGVGYPDIQFNATGTPYVACSVFADDAKVSVLSFDGTNWNFVGTPAFTNNTSSNSSYGAALAFNPVTQEPWLATRVSGNVLDVYVYSGGVWSDEILPNYTISNFNQRLGFRFNSDGEPFVALKRNNGSPLFVSSVVSKQNATWGYVGNSQISEDLVTHVALTLTPTGESVVAFRDDSPGGAGKISVMKASCVITGCTNPAACNYNVDAVEDDGSCLTVYGCTDLAACNYDPTANCDDASCEFTSCLGCTDATACEYDPTVSIDDGSCATFPGDACDDGNVYTENDLIQADCGCEGTPIDTDGDGLSDEEEITIYNTDPFIQDSDYDGLTDGLEINLAGTSPLDPDSDGDGCGDAEAFAGLCPGQEACVGDFNNDNIVNATDLLIFLGSFGSSCN